MFDCEEFGGGGDAIEARRMLEYLNPDAHGSSCDIKTFQRELYELSIIIPAYNVENFVEDCIKSAIGQKTDY